MDEKDYLYQKIGNKGYGKIKSIEVAQKLLETNCSELKNFERVNPRSEGYFNSNHLKAIMEKKHVSDASNQAEKRVFRKAVIDNFKKFAIDYEVNICPGDKQNIDVLFHYNGYLFIGEGKGPKSSGDEPLLKAVLEIDTYSKIIIQEKFVNDYFSNINWLNDYILHKDEIKKAIIIFETKGGNESPMFQQLISEKNYEPIRKLMRNLRVYAIKAEDFCENGKITFFNGFSPNDY